MTTVHKWCGTWGITPHLCSPPTAFRNMRRKGVTWHNAKLDSTNSNYIWNEALNITLLKIYLEFVKPVQLQIPSVDAHKLSCRHPCWNNRIMTKLVVVIYKPTNNYDSISNWNNDEQGRLFLWSQSGTHIELSSNSLPILLGRLSTLHKEINKDRCMCHVFFSLVYLICRHVYTHACVCNICMYNCTYMLTHTR